MTQSTVPGKATHELTLIILCSQAASVALMPELLP
jgi:hypothetical protein